MRKKAIVTFSFDDARQDSYRAIMIARKYGIQATLNVTTGYVDGSVGKKDHPTHLTAMTIEQICELNEKGTEIACHGDKHNNEIGNVTKGKNKLIKWLNLNENDTLGFASPHSKLVITSEVINCLKENSINYLRVGPYIKKVPIRVKIFRKLARITRLNIFFVWAYDDTLLDTVVDNFIVRSIPVLRDNTYEQLKAIIEKAKKKNVGVF